MIYDMIVEELKNNYAADVARRNNMTEGDLTNLRITHDARVLSVTNIKSLITDLENLGDVKCITRNRNAVIIQEGHLGNQYLNGYKKISVSAEAGLILNPRGLDLRIFFRHWRYVFYIEQIRHGDNQKSFQVFSGSGDAVCKIYLTENSDHQALNIILSKYTSDVQAPVIFENVKDESFKKTNNLNIIDAELNLAWRGMKEVHDFYLLMRKYRLGRQEIFNKVDDDLARKVKKNALSDLLSLAKEKKEELTIFISNAGTVQIFTGIVKSLFDKDGWLNVYSGRTKIHLHKDIAECWVVCKPSECGFVTSLEVFNSKGEQIIQIYGQRDEGKPERETWRKLINEI